MKLSIKTAFAATLSAALAATALVAVGQGASAYTGNPPWVAGDTQAKGGVAFYDAPGNVLSGGSDYNHLAAYFGGTSAYRTGATKAAVSIAFPQSGIANPANWLTQSFQLSTTFIPAPSGTPASIPVANPFVKIATSASPTPMDDALGNNAVPDTSTGYNNTFEVRIQDSGTSVVTDGGKYWRAVIEFNPVGSGAPFDGLAEGAWKVLYPAPAVSAVSTSVSTPVASPASPQNVGVPIGLSATVSATDSSHPVGSVHFFDGLTDLGAATTFTAATGVATKTGLTPSAGLHSYTAVFTPTDTVAYNGSTSAALSFEVTAVASDSTATSLSASPVGTADTTAPVVLTATVTDTAAGNSAVVPTGSVQFKDNGTNLGAAVAMVAGLATLTAPAGTLAIGPLTHSFTAEFIPGAGFTASTSSAVPFSITITMPAPSALSPATIGAARVATATNCLPGTWLYATGYSYAWFLDAAVVPFSTAQSSGLLPVGYVGHKIKCVATATNPGQSATSTSAQATVAAGAASKATTRARIIGTPRVGKTLTAYRGIWSPAPPSYTYIWKRGSVIVSRATTYKLTARDKGASITLTVSAVRPGYLTGVSTSLAVRVS